MKKKRHIAVFGVYRPFVI